MTEQRLHPELPPTDDELAAHAALGGLPATPRLYSDVTLADGRTGHVVGYPDGQISVQLDGQGAANRPIIHVDRSAIQS